MRTIGLVGNREEQSYAEESRHGAARFRYLNRSPTALSLPPSGDMLLRIR